MSKIKITLKSDLCNANGEGFASVIDTDIVADEYGIPFIPSRRIKGCLLEAAKMIYNDEQKLRKIFGESGSEMGGSLKFSSSARLDDYDNIKKQVKGFSHEEVLNLFTYTRAATAIENDSAKENSLRFMRVVKQYLPDKDENYKPLVFTTDCTLDECYTDDMKRICKALRNIGYRRNRGFGAVSCEYIPSSDETNSNNFPDILSCDDEYTITITLTNETPLIISTENIDDTLDYIPGGSVLAAFASEYKDSEDFSELFLKDNIRFSNCYIGDIPAPLCYAGLKKNKNKYINLAKDEKNDDDENENDTKKPLKDKYLTVSETGEYYVSKIKKEIIYHNTSEEIGLYTQTALSSGQEFRGTIAGKGKYLKDIKEYFKNKSIRVGKSKTAQYSFCSINFGGAEKVEPKIISSDKIAVILKSDVLLIKDGVYTTDIDELIKAINISGTLDKTKTAVSYTTISGYSSMYNLKKPQAKAFKAGSVFIFDDCDTEKKKETEFVIGSRQGEGFGVCEAVAVEDMKKIVEVDEKKDTTINCGIYRNLLLKSKNNIELKEKAVCFAKNNQLKDVITATQIGRFRRMLTESESIADFNNRIDKIKTDSVQKAATEFFKSCTEEFSDYKDFKLYWDTVLLYHRFNRKIAENNQIKPTEKGGDN